MMKKNVKEQIEDLGPPGLYINPALGSLGSGDFARPAGDLRLGRKAARERSTA